MKLQWNVFHCNEQPHIAKRYRHLNEELIDSASCCFAVFNMLQTLNIVNEPYDMKQSQPSNIVTDTVVSVTNIIKSVGNQNQKITQSVGVSALKLARLTASCKHKYLGESNGTGRTFQYSKHFTLDCSHSTSHVQRAIPTPLISPTRLLLVTFDRDENERRRVSGRSTTVGQKVHSSFLFLVLYKIYYKAWNRGLCVLFKSDK